MHAAPSGSYEEEEERWRWAQPGPGDAGEGQGGDHLHPRAPRAAQPEAQARLGQDHRAEPVQVEIFGFIIIVMLIDHKIKSRAKVEPYSRYFLDIVTFIVLLFSALWL